jgi:hypothetical protein
VVVPAQERHLSDGVVVRAHVVARLLGVRLLRVDADVVLAPGVLERSRRAAPRVRVTNDEGLGTAAQYLDEADAALDAARSTSGAP